MTRPKMKKEVAVKDYSKKTMYITIYSTADAITEFAEFGMLERLVFGHPDEYDLWVDPRYDFDEVLAYIENYGSGDE